MRRWFVASALLSAQALAGQTTPPAAKPSPLPVPSPDTAEAEAIIRRIWDAHLRTCRSSAFEALDGRVLIELDSPRFHIAPTHLKPAATTNGYTYQATAIASARRWRWAPLTKGPLKWTPWQEGQDMSVRFDEFGVERGRTTVEDAVLQFDLVRKDGQWKANRPLSPLNSDVVVIDVNAPGPVKKVPACGALGVPTGQ